MRNQSWKLLLLGENPHLWGGDRKSDLYQKCIVDYFPPTVCPKRFYYFVSFKILVSYSGHYYNCFYSFFLISTWLLCCRISHFFFLFFFFNFLSNYVTWINYKPPVCLFIYSPPAVSRNAFTATKPDLFKPNMLRVGLAFGTTAFLWAMVILFESWHSLQSFFFF